MKIVLQRVTSASVRVDGESCGAIDTGYLLLFGAGHGDNEEHCRRLADKILNLRIFSDENGKINLSLTDVGGSLLVVPQFTLYADCKKGNRPSFINAGSPVHAEQLYEYIIDECRKKGFEVQTGIFGAEMDVELLNDGPFTILLDSDSL